MKAEGILHLESDAVRVTEWRFAPGAQSEVHRHEYDSVGRRLVARRR